MKVWHLNIFYFLILMVTFYFVDYVELSRNWSVFIGTVYGSIYVTVSLLIDAARSRRDES